MASARLTSWAEVGTRVAVARERSGFTQRALADRLGLNRSAITRIELGQRQVDALELAKIADVLGRSVEWFLTEPPATIASHRTGLSAGTDVQRLEDELERTSRDVELLLDIGALTMDKAAPQPGVTTLDEAERSAAQARSKLGIPEGPVTDLLSTVEGLGLLAFSFDLGPSVIDGGYVRLGDIGVALVNGTADAGRRRFNLAHELGHHFLADEYTADFGLGTTKDDREALINAFAVHFLMPRTSMRQRWKELSTEWEDPRTRLVVIGAEYRVSWSAIVAHAVNLELITQSDRKLLEAMRPTRADYFETGARFDEELRPIELAPEYAKAAVRAFRRGVISDDRAIELLRGTITVDDLPRPHEMPMEALAPEFEEIDRP